MQAGDILVANPVQWMESLTANYPLACLVLDEFFKLIKIILGDAVTWISPPTTI